jgi:hypothetical protein
MPFTHTFELFKCAEFKTPISIDGNLQDWEGRDFIELKTVDYLFPPDAFSHELWTGEADLSIKAYVGWDEKNFYFAAKVTDDLFINDNNAGEIWDGDSIQLAFNLLNDAFNSGYKRNDREYTIGSSTKVDHPVILCTWPMPAMEIEAQLAVKRDKGCITYELALPFKRLSPMKPEPGSVFGFNFVALDADYRKVDYWMGLTYGICGGKNPSFFKNFILSK